MAQLLDRLRLDRHALWLILALAAALRLFRLSTPSLWLDEAVIFTQVKADSLSAMLASIEGHIGPLYHICMYFWTAMAGTGEWAMRAPSVVFGVASVAVIFFIGKALFNRRVGLFAAFLLTVSPLHIWYSREARMYALWVLFCLLAAHALVRAVKSGSLLFWALVALFSAAALWTHVNSVFFFAALGLAVLITERKSVKNLLFFSIAMILALASYIPGFMAFFEKEAGGVGSPRPTGFGDLAYGVSSFLTGPDFGPSVTTLRALMHEHGSQALGMILTRWGVFLIPTLAIIGGFALYAAIKLVNSREYSYFSKVFTLSSAIVPLLLVWSAAFVTASVPFNVRYTLCALPFFLLLLAVSAVDLTGWRRWPLAVLLAVWGVGLFNHYFVESHRKVDVRAAIAWVEAQAAPGDRALLFYEHARPVLDYYARTPLTANAYVDLGATAREAREGLAAAPCVFLMETVRTQQYPAGMIDEIERGLSGDRTKSAEAHFAQVRVARWCR